MNRKGTREQNDISIIRNLPKRLQEKIISEGSNKTSANVCTSKNGGSSSNAKRSEAEVQATEAASSSCSKAESPAEVTSIDYFFRMPAAKPTEKGWTAVKPVLENTSGLATGNAAPKKTILKRSEEKVDTLDIVSIPGLIRLNAENVKKLNETSLSENSNSNGLRSHERRNRYQTRQELLASSKNETPMSPVRQIQKVNYPMWFDTLDEVLVKRLPLLFDALQLILNDKQATENWAKLQGIRKDLQDIFEHLLLTNLKFCCEQKVDSFFWKILFYNMREYLKQQQQHDAQAIKYVHKIIDEGIKFYEQLYHKIHKTYLSKKYVASTEPSTAHSWSQRAQQKVEFIAKVIAQKLLICLGDLWRYKIKDAQGHDYSEAEKYYQQAQALVPSNGVPYNQLAIIAILNRKKFDAIYFHMRSLMSSNAIYSSKESLLVLFDEIRKKYEETELKSSPIHSNYHNNNQQLNSKSMRKEVWIYPDGMRRLHRTDVNGNSNYKVAISEEKRFSEMPAEELLRRFTSLYLYIIGKLFTGVGMETIVEHQRKLFLQLSVLLKQDKLAITKSRLLKILALNIFVVEHNLNKDTRRYHAFNFCNQFFGLMLRKCCDLLTDLNNNPENFEDENFLDLTSLLQYIRIYVLCLKHHVNIWERIKCEEHIYIHSWLELEKLFELLKQENFTALSCQDVKFEEDIILAGFTPLASFVSKPKDDSVSDESLQFKARLKMIVEFEDFYSEHNKRLENDDQCHFVNEILDSDIKQALDELQNVKSITSIKGEDNVDVGNVADEDDDDDDIENNSENIVVNGDTLQMKPSIKPIKFCVSEQLTHLSKLKKQLEAKTHVKKMYHNKLEEILKYVDTKLYIEVRPKYLLPDTNCFIDCLEDFEKIVNDFKRYTLIIPLTVVKELDGLSKGVKVESSQESMQKHRIHHYDDVSSRAKKSLDFIKSAKSHVKCATTKGSIINASLFGLVEEEHVSNDDKILATALALAKTMSSETSKDGKCFIQTELVLITTDRNLRVKALSRNLTVSELPEFIQWAKDCN